MTRPARQLGNMTPKEMPDRDLVGLIHHHLPKAAELVHSLAKLPQLRERCWVASRTNLDVSGETLARTSAIITAGGDGTILRVVRLAAPYAVPILGINLGRVGFMTELTAEEAAEKIPSYLSESPRVEKRMMLQASVASGSDEEMQPKLHALNDVVIRSAVPRLLEIDITIDSVPFTTCRGDGVITATATGSTGYALSAGGPVLYPEARVILIQPLAPHLSLHNSLVLPQDSVVQLELRSKHEAVLSVDGFSDTTLYPGDVVEIACSPYVARFLRAVPPAAFYSTLAELLRLKHHQASDSLVP